MSDKNVEQQLGEDQSSEQGYKMTRRDFLKNTANFFTAFSLLPSKLQKIEELDKAFLNVFEVIKCTPDVEITDSNLLLVNGIEAKQMYNESSFYLTEIMPEVKALIVHYDGAPSISWTGKQRYADSTINGLNRNGTRGPVVHWCVDGEACNSNRGFGILQTHIPSGEKNPYIGRHLGIALEDMNAETTSSKIQKHTGYTPKWMKDGKEALHTNTIGFEQIGDNFTYDVPNQMPSKQQIANVLGLTIACMKRYDLGIWDVVGHIEVQQKSDPGGEFMAVLRTFILMYAIKNIKSDLPFYEHVCRSTGRYQSPYEILCSIENYYEDGGDRFKKKTSLDPKWYNNGPKWKQWIGFSTLKEGIKDISIPENSQNR